jgi:hypothetical protein
MELNRLFNKYDVTFECKDYRDVIYYKNCVIYLDPPFYKTFDNYTHDRFCYIDYVDFLKWLKTYPTIYLIHSNSYSFTDIYQEDKNEIKEEVEMYNRINSMNPGMIRKELLFRTIF